MGICRQLWTILLIFHVVSSLEIASINSRSNRHSFRVSPYRRFNVLEPFRKYNEKTTPCCCYRQNLQQSTILYSVTEPVDVLTTSDLFYGTIIAFLLAFTASFLQGRRNQDDFDLGEFGVNELDKDGIRESLSNETIVFDSWKEISRPDNYIFYKRRSQGKELQDIPGSPSFQIERAWVVLALLALFIPIFSVEFFFALSRQIICGGDLMNQSDWAELLCSPAVLD